MKKDQTGYQPLMKKSATITLGIHAKLNTEINILTFPLG